METQRKMKLTKVTLITSDLLQIDLMMEILKRLPVKTLIRFLCLSKVFASTIRSGYFKKLFLNQSLTKPKGILYIFTAMNMDSALALVNPKTTTCASASASLAYITDQTRKPKTVAPSVNGLVCYKADSSRLGIHNPSTRRSQTLPVVNTTWKRPFNYYLGYDPIGNDYKVLCVTRKLQRRRRFADEIWILTLGIDHENSSWRVLMSQDAIPHHCPEYKYLCIDGVLYYGALCGTEMNDFGVMSFDVRSEKLCLIKGPPRKISGFTMLVNYVGKIGFIYFANKLDGLIWLWVLEDAAKEEWSRKKFVFPTFVNWERNFSCRRFGIVDIDTDTGELIYASFNLCTPKFSVDYRDTANNSLRIVTIDGTTKECSDWHYVDYSFGQVENLMFL